jgi:YD repeat-containing protein
MSLPTGESPPDLNQPEIGNAKYEVKGDRSRRWRSMWRVHFYAGIFAFPFILLMAITGLVILHTQPIQDLTENRYRKVASPKTASSATASGTTVSYDAQARTVEKAFPDAPIQSFVVGRDKTHATIFHVDDKTTNGRDVFVNPITGQVLGSTKTGGGIVGLANRLHGFLNQKTATVSLPTVSALWDNGKIMRPYVLGDLAIELLGLWTLVLVMSGFVLWWPRRKKTATTTVTSSPMSREDAQSFPLRPPQRFGIRRRLTGRARWRDLHATGGIVLFGAMVLTIISGLVWSTYWGANFTALANEVSPNVWTDTPASPLGARGDLDRFGNQLPWNTAGLQLPASYAQPDATKPAPLSLDDVVRVASQERMFPGYQVSLPSNITNETTGTKTYGSFSLSNSWPRKTSEARTVFVDQFTGKTLGGMDVYGYGTVSRTMDTLVSVHMGTELGVFSRATMTLMCVLAIWSVVSAVVMYTKRRRPGTLGLPRRPVDVRLSRRITIVTALMAILFPVWGLSAAVILLIDRYVIRRIPRLRHAFGQH